MRSVIGRSRHWFVFLLVLLTLLPAPLSATDDEQIQSLQKAQEGKPLGERIAFWAEGFVGIPYDEDPRGAYVSRAAVVADDRVDCMYLTFRAVELALGRSPAESIQTALEKRFHGKGILKDGRVSNYEERFEYGEDMIRSGKWGREITSQIGRSARIQGSRGVPFWEILPAPELLRHLGRLESGDILFFIQVPEKRTVGEAVAHIGIAKVEGAKPEDVYLIHAGGTKKRGGAVKKVSLRDYVSRMNFVGVKITRF